MPFAFPNDPPTLITSTFGSIIKTIAFAFCYCPFFGKKERQYSLLFRENLPLLKIAVLGSKSKAVPFPFPHKLAHIEDYKFWAKNKAQNK